jgi:hypothetical protein
MTISPSDSRGVSDKAREPGWFRRHPKTTAFTLFVGLMTLTVMALDWAAARRLDRLVQQIRASGAPLSVEEFSAARPDVPDAENMALRLLPAGQAIEAWVKSHEAELKDTPVFGRSFGELGARWSDPVMAAFDQCCDDNAAMLNHAIEAALTLETGRYPIEWKASPIETQLPHNASHRMLMRAFQARAFRACQRGDADEASATILAMLRADRALDTEPMLMGGLSRVANCALSVGTIEQLMAAGVWRDDQLVRWDAELARVDVKPILERMFQTERALIHETVTKLYNGRGPNDVVMMVGVMQLIPIVPTIDLTATLATQSRLVEAAKLPPGDAVREADRIKAEVEGMSALYAMTKMLTPSTSRIMALSHRLTALVGSARAGLAAERYRMKHGDWPASLESLVPEFLDAVPIDPFTDAPLRFVNDDRGLLIYSVDSDGTDEGGAIQGMVSPENKARPTDAGFRLLPVLERGREAGEGAESESDADDASTPEDG